MPRCGGSKTLGTLHLPPIYLIVLYYTYGKCLNIRSKIIDSVLWINIL